jgi:hypothetical protein
MDRPEGSGKAVFERDKDRSFANLWPLRPCPHQVLRAQSSWQQYDLLAVSRAGNDGEGERPLALRANSKQIRNDGARSQARRVPSVIDAPAYRSILPTGAGRALLR